MGTRGCLFLSFVLVGILSSYNMNVVEGLGVNWGIHATHKLPGKTVVQMLKDNGIKKVKLFEADEYCLSALSGTDIEVMIAVPNGLLSAMTDSDKAKEWVEKNVTRYTSKGGVNIKYVAVGNEAFLKSYNGSFVNDTFPALKNIQEALNDAGLGKNIKAVTPLNADVYEPPVNNPVPSAGRFRPDILDQMTQIVKFLAENKAPFVVNIYPFLSLYYGNGNFPMDYAFFDGTNNPVVDNGTKYTNVYDANLDTLISSLAAVGHGDLPIMVGEVGWPTDGDANANTSNAIRFYNGLLSRIANKTGTPLRPGADIEVYLFALLDEDAKSILPGNFERHWGIFRYDGQPKFPMDLSGKNDSSLVGAKDVKYLKNQWCALNPDAKDISKLKDNVYYACQNGDCTATVPGSSCSTLDEPGKASYAFNQYFQINSQKPEACGFDGLATIVTKNISSGSCNFTIQLASSPSNTMPLDSSPSEDTSSPSEDTSSPSNTTKTKHASWSSNTYAPPLASSLLTALLYLVF